MFKSDIPFEKGVALIIYELVVFVVAESKRPKMFIVLISIQDFQNQISACLHAFRRRRRRCHPRLRRRRRLPDIDYAQHFQKYRMSNPCNYRSTKRVDVRRMDSHTCASIF